MLLIENRANINCDSPTCCETADCDSCDKSPQQEDFLKNKTNNISR